MTEETTLTSSLELATELTIAWLSNPNTRASAEDVPAFLSKIHEALGGLIGGQASNAEQQGEQEYTPAVTVRKSLSSKDHIISLIDGKPYKTLRRHLSRHGLTPEQYRERYNLKGDYPMVAETYAQTRRDLAKKIGLGRKAGQKAAAPAKAPAAKTARGRTAKPGAAAAEG